MKSVFVISAITFGLIYGGLALTSHHIAQTMKVAAPRREPAPRGTAVASDAAGAQRNLAPASRTTEELMAQRQTLVVQELTLAAAQRDLEATVAKLETAQQQYTAAKDRSARKLAKMYEAMKPAKAAPILASLDMDVVLDIIARMQERQSARILAQMHAGLAAHISARLSSKGDG